MAFEWDDAQGRELQRRFEGKARHFETKLPVGKSLLEVDALVEGPPADDFFDFLSDRNLFENKAPSQSSDWMALVSMAARTLLYARGKRLERRDLEEVTQVALCSRLVEGLRRELGLRPIRPGVGEGFYVARLVVVEANALEVEERTLPLLLLFATGDRLVEGIEMMVGEEHSEYYGLAHLLRHSMLEEVLNMTGKILGEETIEESIKAAFQDLRARGFFRRLRPEELNDLFGEAVIEKIGVEALIEKIGVEALIEKIGVEALIEKIGRARLEQALAEMNRRSV